MNIAAKAARAALPEALAALALAGRAVATREPLQRTLDAIVGAVALAVGAEVVVVWVRERNEELVARAVWASAASLRAEIEGLRLGDAAAGATALRELLGPGAAAIAVQLDASDRELGMLELLRHEGEFDPAERQFASLAADLALLATQLCGDEGRDGSSGSVLELAGDALAAASDERETGAHVARIAAMASEADGALLWLLSSEGVVLDGLYARTPDLAAATAAAETIMLDPQSTAVHELPEGSLVVLRLGQPPIGVLQLLYRTGGAPEQLAPVASFAVRAAHALRAAGRARELAVELERSRALLAVVGEAIASLSLAHTLETAVEHVADAARLGPGRGLPRGGRRADGRRGARPRATARAGRSCRARARPTAHGADTGSSSSPMPPSSPSSDRPRDEAAAAEITSVLALPLLVQEGLIGLLAVYPRRPARLTPNESALLVALAAQLAVAVQNARLHERATSLGDELEAALSAEREAAKRLRALYEISGTFAQSLSLADDARRPGSLDRDAARCRCSGDSDARRTRCRLRRSRRRGERRTRRRGGAGAALAAAAAHPRGAAGAPGAAGAAAARRAVRLRRSRVRTRLLAPFLEKGSTAAIVPIESAGELLATLTIVSLHPERPVAGEIADTALSITGQAALAIDNARLYGQQKEFADTMQRSLLPREVPDLAGLEIGDVYESAARVDVGGDVYDYLVLGGRAPRCRTRRRHGPRRRGHCGHGDGQVRLSLARSGAHGSGRVPRCRERGRRLRGRRGQVHHDGRARPRHRCGNGHLRERRASRTEARAPRRQRRPDRCSRACARDRPGAGVRAGHARLSGRRQRRPLHRRRRRGATRRGAVRPRAPRRVALRAAGPTFEAARDDGAGRLPRLDGAGELADDFALVVIKRSG